MAGLKSAAEARGCADGRVLLVLPDDQVLYTSFMAPADDPERVTERIVEGLEGMTPYAVADLAYDWRAVEVGPASRRGRGTGNAGRGGAVRQGERVRTGRLCRDAAGRAVPGHRADSGKTRPDLPEAKAAWLRW